MSRAIFIENVAKKGKLSKAEAKRTVDLVLGEIEAGLKKSKKAGRYTIGNFGTFSIVKRKGRKGRNPQTGEAIRIRASKALRFRPAAPRGQNLWLFEDADVLISSQENLDENGVSSNYHYEGRLTTLRRACRFPVYHPLRCG